MQAFVYAGQWPRSGVTPEPALSQTTAHLVYVIDDDRDVRNALEAILSLVGFEVHKFASAREFLANCRSNRPSCVLVDVRMPEMDGLALQEEIARIGLPCSTIIITGYADVELSVRAMKAGAFDFLEKPFDNSKLTEIIPGALKAASVKLAKINERDQASARWNAVSPREREVAMLVAEGLTNKEVAEKLKISVRTAELHRARAMEKLQVATATGLVRAVLSVETVVDAVIPYNGQQIS